VSESTTKLVLDKLLPDTQYTVTVVPIYAEGDGPSLEDHGKTSECWVVLHVYQGFSQTPPTCDMSRGSVVMRTKPGL